MNREMLMWCWEVEMHSTSPDTFAQELRHPDDAPKLARPQLPFTGSSLARIAPKLAIERHDFDSNRLRLLTGHRSDRFLEL